MRWPKRRPEPPSEMLEEIKRGVLELDIRITHIKEILRAMPTLADFNALADRLSAAHDALAAEIKSIGDQLAAALAAGGGSISSTDAQAAIDRLTAVTTSIEGLEVPAAPTPPTV